MSRYNHIIFDLDHTLWDFTANSNATLSELYTKYNLADLGVNLNAFLSVYQVINDQMWAEYHRGQITKNDIREKRFLLTLEQVGVQSNQLAGSLNEDYLRICPSKGFLVKYAVQILEYLTTKKYQLHILTNGFHEIQNIKLSTSGLDKFFREIVNSETCGFLKPDKRVFDFTLDKIKGDCSECIMIGDDLLADVLGAKNAGIDHIFFNRKNIRHQELLTYEISCLSELKDIL